MNLRDPSPTSGISKFPSQVSPRMAGSHPLQETGTGCLKAWALAQFLGPGILFKTAVATCWLGPNPSYIILFFSSPWMSPTQWTSSSKIGAAAKSHLDGKTGGSGREFPFTSNPFNPLTISDLGKAWQICCWARQISNSIPRLQSQGGVMWPALFEICWVCTAPIGVCPKKCGCTHFFFNCSCREN